MSRVIALLLRFAVVIAGYALACLASSIFINIAVLGSHDFASEEAGRIAAAWSLVTIPVLALVIANLAFVPAMAVAIAAELLGWRSWLTHALAGGGIGILVAAIVRRPDSAVTAVDAPGALAVIAAAGLVGGIVYWMVAGRRARGWISAGERPISPGP